MLTYKGITKTPGKLKDENPYPYFPGDNLGFYFYNNGIIEDSLFIKHPLKRNIEFIDENNRFVTKQIDLDSTDFFIRIQLKESYGTLNIKELIYKKKYDLLHVNIK